MQYTLPQISELVKRANKYIQFEVDSKVNPMNMLGGMYPMNSTQDSEYQEIQEDDIGELISALSGS